MGSIKKEIIKANNKEKKALSQNAWYSNHIARPISLWITKPFINFEPTQICFFMILIGLISLPFFAIGSYASILIGALILQVHYIFDHIDGNVARLMNKKTKRGKYLDFVPNIFVNPLVLLLLGYGHFISSGNIDYLLFGVSASFFFLAREPARLFRYLMIQELNLKQSKSQNKTNSSILVKFNKWLNIFFDYPGIMNLILIFALLGITEYLVIVYGILMPLIFLARVFYEFNYWKGIDLNEKK